LAELCQLKSKVSGIATYAVQQQQTWRSHITRFEVRKTISQIAWLRTLGNARKAHLGQRWQLVHINGSRRAWRN
jgi:hypothetical protein